MGGDTPMRDVPALADDDEGATEPPKKKAKVASGPLDPALSAASGGDQPWATPGSKLAPTPLSSDMVHHDGGVVLACTSSTSAAPAEPLPPFDLRVQLWNLQDLGGGPSRGPRRSDATIAAIAEIIHRADADVTAIIEVHRSGHGVSSNPKYPGSERGANRAQVAGCSTLGLAVFSWANKSAIKALLTKAIEAQKKRNWPEGLKAKIDQFSFQSVRYPFSNDFRSSNKNKQQAAGCVNAILDSLQQEFGELLKVGTAGARQLGACTPVFLSEDNHSLLGGTFGQEAERNHSGELGRWIDFWEKHESLDDDPGLFFQSLAQEAQEAQAAKMLPADLDIQAIMEAGGCGEGVVDVDEEPESMDVGGEEEPESMDVSAAPSSDADDAENEEHFGFQEILRIIKALNAVAKKDVYESMPTLQEVKMACPVKQQARKRSRDDEPILNDHSDCYYTKGESYAFIYRSDRTRRAGKAPGKGSKPTDFRFLPEFQQRKPAMATFVFGGAEVDFIAHHPPAEANSTERVLLRTAEFKALAKQLAEIRKRPRLCFYLADTNADTRPRKEEMIPFTDGLTRAKFLASLSDHPRYPVKSLFARTPTSHRRSKNTIADANTSKPAALLKDIDELQQGCKSKAPQSEGLQAEVPAKTRDQPMIDERRSRAIVGFYTVIHAQQDPYRTRAKAFDKIAIVRGSNWTYRMREWVVPLAYAVEPRPPAYSEGPTESLFEHVPDWAWPRMNEYRYLIGEKLREQPYKNEKIFADLTTKPKKPANERARVEQLLKVVNLLSDHSPCVLECTVDLPRDYPRTSCDGAPEPRKQGDNSAFGGYPGVQALPPANRGLTDGGDLRLDEDLIDIVRAPCLVQGENSCGVRAALNAAALHSNRGLLCDHDELCRTFKLDSGMLPEDVMDDEVVHALRARGVASEVAFLGHFDELHFLAAWTSENAWRRVQGVGRGENGASAVLVINTIGNSAAVAESRIGYGHYLAVHLEVKDDRVLVTYADSLAGGDVATRAPLLRALVEQIRSGARLEPLEELPPAC